MKTEAVDLIMFMGQSNMAGRGDFRAAPKVEAGTAYEYRAVSAPDGLLPLKEPFGVWENDKDGVYEPGMKTGSLTAAFVNACFQQTGVPITGVSCSKGGSSILDWMPEQAYYKDGVRRMKRCEHWLSKNGYIIRHRLMAWCQGCTDGDRGMDKKEYRECTRRFLHAFMADCGIEICFLIQTGSHRDNPELYVPIQLAQEELAAEERNVIMVSRQLKTFAGRGLMKDEFHYCQEAYNLTGDEAGNNAGKYLQSLNTGKGDVAPEKKDQEET